MLVKSANFSWVLPGKTCLHWTYFIWLAGGVANTLLCKTCLHAVRLKQRAGSHNSGNSKGQIDHQNLPRVANVYLISMWRFRCSTEEIQESQLLIRGRDFATFCAIDKLSRASRKTFAGRIRPAGSMLCRPGIETCSYCLEKYNFKTAWISPVFTEWIVTLWSMKYMVTIRGAESKSQGVGGFWVESESDS